MKPKTLAYLLGAGSVLDIMPAPLDVDDMLLELDILLDSIE